MDIIEVLQIADNLVFADTGKHLDDIQETVIKGVWEGKTYDKIADDSHCSESHIRNIGYKLWRTFSNHLEQDIHKSNFRSTLSRLKLTSSPIFIQQNNNIRFNFCPSYPQLNKNETPNNNNQNQQSFKHDLKSSPQIIRFYERKKELENLDNWILNKNTRLVSVLGLNGIGKTTLVKRFIDLNLQQFEVIIWRSLKFPKSLDLLIDDLLKIAEQESQESTDNKLRKLLDFLTEKRCLIIIDDLENIFASGQFAGSYQNEYKNYQTLLTMITEVEHQSSLILISQEKCTDMDFGDEELSHTQYLELSRLQNVEILKNLGLKNEDSWLKLIDLYEGNPLYLKDIAVLIKDIFNGYVDDFMAENNLIITKNMQFNLSQVFNRLSSIEQQIVLALSKFNQPAQREDIKQNLDLSSMQLINGLQSLKQRYLLKTVVQEKVLFNLSAVFKEYLQMR
jgi:ABC-type cobalamin/Fe3+-siderophores transport system ATPase subunit